MHRSINGPQRYTVVCDKEHQPCCKLPTAAQISALTHLGPFGHLVGNEVDFERVVRKQLERLLLADHQTLEGVLRLADLLRCTGTSTMIQSATPVRSS
jgi:hypothetical protein